MYTLVFIPVIIALIVQVVKLITDNTPNNLNWQHLMNDYGGMPSSHTAFVTSIMVLVGMQEGFGSIAFGLAFALFVVVVRDAVGFRREIGKNAVLTNMIAQEIFPENPEVLLTERIGHTPAEVIGGFLLGGALTFLLYYLMLII